MLGAKSVTIKVPSNKCSSCVRGSSLRFFWLHQGFRCWLSFTVDDSLYKFIKVINFSVVIALKLAKFWHGLFVLLVRPPPSLFQLVLVSQSFNFSDQLVQVPWKFVVFKMFDACLTKWEFALLNVVFVPGLILKLIFFLFFQVLTRLLVLLLCGLLQPLLVQLCHCRVQFHVKALVTLQDIHQ